VVADFLCLSPHSFLKKMFGIWSHRFFADPVLFLLPNLQRQSIKRKSRHWYLLHNQSLTMSLSTTGLLREGLLPPYANFPVLLSMYNLFCNFEYIDMWDFMFVNWWCTLNFVPSIFWFCSQFFRSGVSSAGIRCRRKGSGVKASGREQRRTAWARARSKASRCLLLGLVSIVI